MRSTEVSVLQWNVWYEEDIRHIAEFLKATPADIICLQELTVDYPKQTVADTPAYIAEQFGYFYAHKALTMGPTEGGSWALANGIFSRFPIIDQRAVWINQPEDDGGYSDEYRAYVEASLDVGGRRLRVGTAHMSYTDRFKITPRKRAETDWLIRELKLQTDDTVFMGDINATPDSYTFKEINKLLPSVGPPLEQKTWATKPFSYDGFEESELNWRLDYIFASPDIEVLEARILKTDYSDHLPVLARLRLTA